MLGAFLLGVSTTRTTGAGAIAGIAVSLACMVALKAFTAVAWTWYVLIGTVLCALVGTAVSRLGPSLEATPPG